MSRLLPLLLCLACLPHPALAGEGRPSRADLQRVMEQHARSVVRVRGPKQASPGVIVGAAGQVLTSTEPVGGEAFVGLNAATVEHDGKALPARVVLANAALKVAVVAAPDGTYPAAPVKLLKEGDSLRGRWVVGVLPATKAQPARPVSAQVGSAPAPFFDVPLALPAGSPVFDSDGRLVAVVVQRHRRGCRVLPLTEVKVQLASADAP
ncbi:MXAN_2756 family trypsin-like serine endoprotease [Pyxidicoccus xibeiensis]|uniref:MXAN_2756 family trypsin-like serine endoprotease n=1 Tax=Pyxidicoccus xibeiensis TaxID=2906759 RepID=UPI0020A7639F|nr:trypsin-like peptidase domain-containing protein [Pyxidicoccus xibeiensis]MCP3141071.1 serine protease [Pyxidicoccus xibeiensis]